LAGRVARGLVHKADIMAQAPGLWQPQATAIIRP
jgi:hypothetical protein